MTHAKMLGAALLVSGACIAEGCAKTCAVVDLVNAASDVAHDGCALVRYRDELGQTREVRLSERSLARSAVTGERAVPCPR
jgi:hypothetical protein